MFPEKEEQDQITASQVIQEHLAELAKQPVMNRQQRREMERQALKEMAQDRDRAKRSVEKLKSQVEAVLKTYTDSYNDYATDHPDNSRGLKSLQMPWHVNTTTVPLKELTANAEIDDVNAFNECMSKEKPDEVQVMYFRVETIMRIANPDLVARPGIPEMVEDWPGTNGQEKGHTQLFYHAIYPVRDMTNEYEGNKAIEKLISDFLIHLTCMGIDMQNMNNQKLWDHKLSRQMNTINSKAKEVEEMFSHIGQKTDERNPLIEH